MLFYYIQNTQCRIYAYILCRNLNIWVKAQHQKTYKNMERDKRKSNLKTHHLIFISLTAFWYLFLLILTWFFLYLLFIFDAACFFSVSIFSCSRALCKITVFICKLLFGGSQSNLMLILLVFQSRKTTLMLSLWLFLSCVTMLLCKWMSKIVRKGIFTNQMK